jgi:hypothetical protein
MQSLKQRDLREWPQTLFLLSLVLACNMYSTSEKDYTYIYSNDRYIHAYIYICAYILYNITFYVDIYVWINISCGYIAIPCYSTMQKCQNYIQVLSGTPFCCDAVLRKSGCSSHFHLKMKYMIGVWNLTPFKAILFHEWCFSICSYIIFTNFQSTEKMISNKWICWLW